MVMVVLSARGLAAQSYDLARQTDLLGDLSRATWRFHTGDDPHWADPAFDDSHWSLLSAQQPWDVQGYKGYSGVAWYRIHLKMPPEVPLGIAPGLASDSYELFIDGKNGGHWGSLTPSSVPLTSHLSWSLVANAATHGPEVVLALRVWHWPVWASYAPGGMTGRPFLVGDAQVVSRTVALQKANSLVLLLPGLLTGGVTLLAAVLSLLLYRRDPASHEYLWFGLSQLAIGLASLETWTFARWLLVSVNVRDLSSLYLSELSAIFTLIFLFRFIGQPLTRWARWLLLCQIPISIFSSTYFAFIPVGVYNLVSILNNSALCAGWLWVVAHNARISRAARRLILPVALLSVSALTAEAALTLLTAGLSSWLPASMRSGHLPPLFSQPFRLGADDAAQLCFLAVMAYILTERFAETQAERTRLHGEFEAAQQVQRLLLASPISPGNFVLDVSYLPASEVGGDFFQTLEQEDGSVLVVIGDVSGKGLQAAMTVSTVLGALRGTTVHAPAAILTYLNHVLQGQITGFVTCCSALFTPNGMLTLANAGHLSPYLNGEELAIASGLPLGLVKDIQYDEVHYQLAPSDRLTFVSDGVVEATNAQKELFGFDRTLAISNQSAKQIAETARNFGQQDDITVLTFQMAPQPPMASPA